RSVGSVGSTANASTGTSGRFDEMFVQVWPPSVVRNTCFEGKPRYPAKVAYALWPSVVTDLTRVTGELGKPVNRAEKVAPPSVEKKMLPVRVPPHTGPGSPAGASRVVKNEFVTLAEERATQAAGSLPKPGFAQIRFVPRRTVPGAVGNA